MSEKRRELEATAAELVQRSGLHNLSFRTLADKVGVKSSSVHYYFPEKSHLASVLIENYASGFREKLDKINSRKRDLKQKLDAFIKIFEDVIKADKLCLCGMMAAESSTLDDHNKALLATYFDDAETWLVDVLNENQQQIASPISTVKLARIILSGLEGAILIDRVGGGKERMQAQKELIHQLIR